MAEACEHRRGLWHFMRKRDALLSSPVGPTGSIPAHHPSLDDHEAVPVAENPLVSVGWDPQASHWLPPATPAAPAATPDRPSTAGSTGTDGKRRTGMASIWGKLKRGLGGKSRKAGGLLGAGSPSPGLSTVPHSPPSAAPSAAAPLAIRTTGTLPDALLAAPSPYGAPAARPTRIPKPPGGSGSSTPLTAASSTPGSDRQLLRAGHALGSVAGGGDGGGGGGGGGSHEGFGGQPAQYTDGFATTAAAGRRYQQQRQQQQQQQGHAMQASSREEQPDGGADEPAVQRRLVFSPGMQHQHGAPSQPVPIGRPPRQPRQGQQQQQQQQQEWPHRQRRLSWSQGDQQPPQAAPPAAFAPGGGDGGGLRRSGSQPIDVPLPSGGGSTGLPSAAADSQQRLSDLRASLLRGPPIGGGGGGGAAAGALPPLPAAAQHALGVPSRSGLAGRWVRNHDRGGDGGGAAVSALLQVPPLVAAARERTRELEVCESDEALTLQWVTHLANGSRIRGTPQALPKSGALAAVARPDGRAGSAAAQLAFDIEPGSLSIKTLQGPPLPALLHQKLRMSPSGTRLRVSLKVQLLDEGEWPGGGARSRGGAKTVTQWRRVAAS